MTYRQCDWEPEFVFGHRYPERLIVYETIRTLSEEARREPGARCDLAYGAHPLQKLDLFPAGPNAPLVVFIHGGYWRSQDRRNYDFVAPTFRACGLSVAVPGYPLAPEATLDGIVGSLSSALTWLRDNAEAQGAGADGLYLCGHSAGGHLAATLASLAFGHRGLPTVRGCLPISGIFDLRPLLDTSINVDVRLDSATADRFSPMAMPAGEGWLVSAHGTQETSVFQTQAAAYVDHCRCQGRDAELLPLAGRNHYDILLDLASCNSRIAAVLRKKIAADRPAAQEAIRGNHGQTAVRQL